MVHVDAGLDWGGGQSQSLGLALGLAARGHRVTFIAQPGSRLAMRAREGGLSLVEVRMRSQFDLVALLKLKRRFRDLQAEVVHLHDSRSHALGGLAARWAGVPVVLAHKRTDRVPAGGWWSRRKYERWVDRVICVSEASRRAALLGGVPADRLVLIHDSVDTDWFRPPADREQAKGALGYRPEDLLVVQVGRFCPAKGQRVLVEAAARVVQKLPAARFLLCGEGPEEKRLRARVQELALERAIRFEGFREDVRPVLAAADVAAMPSRQEGLGVAALEAMAMAAPVVASRAGGLPEAVAEGETGLLVAPGDAGELAQGLLRLLADPRLRERMGKRGRERVEREFAREAMVARTEQLYLELAEGKRRWQRSAR
jgi:glycosyltransferase involved in cell wall biosynthesis